RKPPVLGCRREEVERMAPVGVLQTKEMVEVRARVGPVAGLILVGPEVQDDFCAFHRNRQAQ
ncbi:hypothetical protein Tco_1240105, partial [Tanacetum coccineum]